MKLKTFLTSFAILVIWQIPSYGCTSYEYPPSEYLLYRVFDPLTTTSTYSDVEQLSESDDPEVKRYLQLARTCEKLRQIHDSKWYYPSKDDDVILCSLEEVLDEALSYKGGKLKDRYALQAARAMFTLQRYWEMIKWWSDVKYDIQDEYIRRSIEGYVAGALFRTGEKERALSYYTEVGDISSIAFCLQRMGNYSGDRTLLEYFATHCPDNSGIIRILQDYITRLELHFDYKASNNANVVACYEMCMKAAAHSKKPARWLYSAAFLKNLMGQPYVASNILYRAEQCQSSTFLMESIKVLRILIDSQIYPYNRAYEKRLLEDLKWLDEKIYKNISEDVREKTSEIHFLKYGYSYYYWNDMMRKIILGTVVPRMIQAGKTPLALLLANYADYRLLMLVNLAEVWDGYESTYVQIDLEQYRDIFKYYNRYDYSNNYFRILDQTSVDGLIGELCILSNPQSAIEKFLHARAYTDMDYHNEIIGTRFLRELKYEDAAHYLNLVSDKYPGRLNTYWYYELDPFQIGPDNYGSGCYKTQFAARMVEYENIIKQTKDKDIKGEAMVKAGLGIRASFKSCWALTHYGKSEYNPWYESQQTLDKIAYAHTLIKNGLETIENSELAARYYKSLYQWKTVVEKFPDTTVAKQIIISCDNLVNYTYTQPPAQDPGHHVNLNCW